MNSTKQAMAILIASSLIYVGPASAQATQSTQSTESRTTTTTPGPIAGKSSLGVAVVEMDAIIAGWSVKEDMLRKAVVNEKNEKIGSIDDVIVTSNPGAKTPAASFAIIGAGGFLGIKKHDVAIPMEQLRIQNGKIVLAGATKETLKALPAFEYRRK